MEQFGTLDGRQVVRAHLQDGDTSVSVLNYGAVTQDWQVGGRHVVLGFETFEAYPVHSRSFGIIAGRVANRTAHGRFELGGQTYQLATNNGAHHLHGGDVGLGRRLWRMEADSRGKALRLQYHSPDGEDGYPGAVDFDVVIRLRGRELTYDMAATPDRETPINLAQHNYYNLGGADVRGHKIWVDASGYTPVDKGLIPTGEIAALAGTHFDYRRPVTIGAADPQGLGVDLNFVLRAERAKGEPAARVDGPDGLSLSLKTDQPGLQIFNAPEMEIPVPGLGGQGYGRFGGLCLEPQHFPNALNTPAFGSILCSPEQPYRQILSVRID